jgi:hypothetical protein
MAALPWFDVAVSQTESSEKSSLRVSFPIPGLISGVPVYVGNASTVAVAEGGNQTIVSVGIGVSVGTGVSVGGVEFNGKQATNNNVVARRVIFPTKQSPRVMEARFVFAVLRSARISRNDIL